MPPLLLLRRCSALIRGRFRERPWAWDRRCAAPCSLQPLYASPDGTHSDPAAASWICPRCE